MRGVIHDHEVIPGIARADRLDEFDERFDLDLDPRLFPHLPHRGLFERLTPFERSARDHPLAVVRSLSSLDEEDLVLRVEDHGAHADHRTPADARRPGGQGVATVGSGAGV